MPVEAIADLAHAAGAEIFVDAIQGLGAIPFQVQGDQFSGVDYLSAGGHKWLMGTEGAGFLYIRPEAAEALVPRLAGWISHEDAFQFLTEGEGHLRYDRPFKRDASFFEGGSQNTLGYAAVGASLALLETLGVARIAAHLQRYHDVLEPEFVDRGFQSLRHHEAEGRSGSLCFRAPPNVDVLGLAHHLGAQGISVATPDGKLRLSPHWPNDVERERLPILNAVDQFLRS
jgi:selenocysteine lyase/cysteine desulfurase